MRHIHENDAAAEESGTGGIVIMPKGQIRDSVIYRYNVDI